MRTRLIDCLDQQQVHYERIEHPLAYTMPEVAASAHLSGNQMAKTVIVELDGEMVMAVLPAHKKIILQDLRDLTGSDHVKFVSETDFTKRFPDCEIGAMPPFGNLYGMEVFVAESLAHNGEIAFNACTHREIIKMSFADFERLVEPKVLSFTA